mmetsp:Transcript_23588/g.74072  ORF Transcript_23588/g.74072 Transcript_23588/m.74072 type:complete len:234 (-) Transcript_23588:1631-2332(-)
MPRACCSPAARLGAASAAGDARLASGAWPRPRHRGRHARPEWRRRRCRRSRVPAALREGELHVHVPPGLPRDERGRAHRSGAGDRGAGSRHRGGARAAPRVRRQHPRPRGPRHWHRRHQGCAAGLQVRYWRALRSAGRCQVRARGEHRLRVQGAHRALHAGAHRGLHVAGARRREHGVHGRHAAHPRLREDGLSGRQRRDPLCLGELPDFLPPGHHAAVPGARLPGPHGDHGG